MTCTNCVLACETVQSFECPDERAVRLLAIASSENPSDDGFKNAISAYAYVIANATRPMDEVALRSACHRLALFAYMAAHPEVGKTLNLGQVPPKDAVKSLLQEHPILEQCPAETVYESYAPVRRPVYTPPEEAVKNALTGWVDLELDISDTGTVEKAIIIDSSDPGLESGIVEHVLQFRYPSKSHYSDKNMPRKGFKLRIVTHYFHIARAKGCEWVDPRRQGI